MIQDAVNGGFETLGAVAVWVNVRRLWKDRMVRGIDPLVTVFFTVWGVWNLYYYPSLNQWYSFAGGALLASGNLAWVLLLWRFGWKITSTSKD
jgi:hypothetical protein